jgi:prepilin-type N-terminal cleavage/methylation domain-containing protein
MNKRGFTLIEMVIVLAVVAILAAILTPTIAKNIEDSKKTKASADVKVIGAAVASFYKDVGVWPGDADGDLDGNDLYALSSSNGQGATGTIWETWASGSHGDSFKNQLISNTIKSNAGWYYSRSKWKGPYFSEDKEDPWGRKYYCNVLVGYYGTGTYDYTTMMVLSAGSDGTIQTPIGSAANSRAIVEVNSNDIGVTIYGRQDW